MNKTSELDKELELKDFCFSKKGETPSLLFKVSYVPFESVRGGIPRQNIIGVIHRFSPDVFEEKGLYIVHNIGQDYSLEGLEITRERVLIECGERYSFSDLREKVILGKQGFIDHFTDEQEYIYRLKEKDLISCLADFSSA